MTPARPSMRTVPSVAFVVAGEDPQDGRLADAVRADERDALAVADTKRDVVEQAMSAARALPRQALHFDRAHGEATLRGRRAGAAADSADG